MFEEVELHLGVQRREGFRSISPGLAPQPWHGDFHPLRERGGAGGSHRLSSRTSWVLTCD